MHYSLIALLILLVSTPLQAQQAQQQVHHKTAQSAIMICLQHCARLHSDTSNMQSARHKISTDNSMVLTKLLQNSIEEKCDIDMQNDCECTILMYFAEFGITELIEECLKHEADATKKDLLGRTALMKAAHRNHYDVAQLLLQHNAQLAKQMDKYRWSALTYAAIGGNEALVKLLLEHGADLYIKDKLRRSIAEIAHEHGRHSGNTITTTKSLCTLCSKQEEKQTHVELSPSLASTLTQNSIDNDSSCNSQFQLIDSDDESENEC